MNKLLIFTTIALAFASEACAQSRQAPSDAHQRGGGSGGWMQRDMTRQQAQQMADSLFDRLDTNHDGTLTRDEVEQAKSQMGAGGGRRGGGRVDRMIFQLFGDSQSVTLAQAEAQALARFDSMDLNHDGVVTSDERHQARANRGGQH